VALGGICVLWWKCRPFNNVAPDCVIIKYVTNKTVFTTLSIWDGLEVNLVALVALAKWKNIGQIH